MSEILELDSSHGKERLGVFASELFLSVAEQERRTERSQRQAEAIAAAKARGVRLGREPMSLPEGFEELAEDWRDSRVSAAEAGRMLGNIPSHVHPPCGEVGQICRSGNGCA